MNSPLLIFLASLLGTFSRGGMLLSALGWGVADSLSGTITDVLSWPLLYCTVVALWGLRVGSKDSTHHLPGGGAGGCTSVGVAVGAFFVAWCSRVGR